MTPLLSIKNLQVSFKTNAASVPALRGVDLSVSPGECLGLVGESGSGKSLTALSILGLLPPGGKIERGEIRFDDLDLARASERTLSRIRGASIGMVCQEPMASLNPVYTVGRQIVEAIRLNTDAGRGAAKRLALEWLARVGIPEPARRFESYPHELSGGMRQRALLAMALAPKPRLLLADEPTTAVDRSVEADILDLLAGLREEDGLSILLVSHDIAVVSELADRVVVMYAGEVVEEGPLAEVLGSPQHPYTQALLDAIPRAGDRPPRRLGDRPPPLRTIEGSVPSARELPSGCRFRTRCPHAFDACEEGRVPFFAVGRGHARCLLVDAPRSKRALALDLDAALALERDEEEPEGPRSGEGEGA
jgi:oligopeptide/dipeptide ABC transporter ATP-binding protein